MKYYKTDSRKISFVEYWHMSRKGFWLGWWNKLIGKQMNFSRGIPEPRPLAERLISADAIPGPIFQRLGHGISELREAGFDQFWYYNAGNSLTGGISYAVEALHSSREIVAKVIYVFVKTRESFITALLSSFADGTTLATTNKKRDFTPPRGSIVHRHVGAGAAHLLQMHLKQLDRQRTRKQPLTFPGFAEVAAFEDKFLQASYADKIRRGIWVEMSDAEVKALRAQRGVPPPIPKG